MSTTPNSVLQLMLDLYLRPAKSASDDSNMLRWPSPSGGYPVVLHSGNIVALIIAASSNTCRALSAC